MVSSCLPCPNNVTQWLTSTLGFFSNAVKTWRTCSSSVDFFFNCSLKWHTFPVIPLQSPPNKQDLTLKLHLVILDHKGAKQTRLWAWQVIMAHMLAKSRHKSILSPIWCGDCFHLRNITQFIFRYSVVCPLSECELKVAKKPQIFARPFGTTSDHFESEESLDSAVSSLKFNKLRNAGIVCSFCAEREGRVFLQLNVSESPICSSPLYLKSNHFSTIASFSRVRDQAHEEPDRPVEGAVLLCWRLSPTTWIMCFMRLICVSGRKNVGNLNSTTIKVGFHWTTLTTNSILVK